jgi:L-threonylcarbamoyladenylate synthase
VPQVDLPELVAAARAGQLVGFPTDTVPAIAAIPAAAAAIYAAKQRTTEKPLILMAATPEELWPFVKGGATAQAIWNAVAARHWPGALTLVLPKGDRSAPKIHDITAINSADPATLGIRVPNWPLALEILKKTGPLVTTSLNRSGQPPLENLSEIIQAFPSLVTPSADLWDLPPGKDRVPSTVAQWRDEGWLVLRQGFVRLEPNR